MKVQKGEQQNNQILAMALLGGTQGPLNHTVKPPFLPDLYKSSDLSIH